MARKNKKAEGSGKTVLRIIKDTRPIRGALILSALLSFFSALLAMAAPSIVGRLTDAIYGFFADGEPIIRVEYIKLSLLLLTVYILSSLFSTLTMSLMNNFVSRHYTCRIRVEMSEKISKIPQKTVDSTPNGEIISRMTSAIL